MELLTRYRGDIARLFAKRYLNQNVNIERIRFFARKTIKYGHLVKVKLGENVFPAYYCWFYSGFGVYVVFWDLPEIRYDERKIFAVMIENPEHDGIEKTVRAPPTLLFAVDWFYPS